MIIKHRQIKILALIFFLSISSTELLYSGWIDHDPIPINSLDNPGDVEYHANSGGRRLVRIDDTIIAICPHGEGEYTYRSNKNDASWTRIDTDGAPSGCLITGPDNIIYHFYRLGDQIFMVKFRYDEIPPDPVPIHSNEMISETITGVYKAINATAGPDGTLYVACHWGQPDRLYLLTSSDQGASWNGPYEISQGASGWYFPHIEVNRNNLLVCTYDKFQHDEHEIMFAKSSNGGLTWDRKSISREITFNPSILTVGERSIFIFAQSIESDHKGLVFVKSDDTGETWTDWKLIDPTCGYADPSPGLGLDGNTIFLAYRSSNGTGVTSGSCGNQSRSRLAMSPDLGETWEFVDNHYNAERTGTRSQIRYQTWWNYGGPLEWIWMQNEDGGFNRPIYYDINTDVQIYDAQSSTVTPNESPSGDDPPADGTSGQEPGNTSSSKGTSGGAGSSCFILTIGLAQ
jgi:hypothetical protein